MALAEQQVHGRFAGFARADAMSVARLARRAERDAATIDCSNRVAPQADRVGGKTVER
jgi:hypothetical protein